MAPTNIKTVHQTSLTPYREQPRSTRIVVAYPRPAFSATNRTNTFQTVLINNSKFLKATHRTKIRKIEIPRSMVVEALSWWSRRASQHPAVQSPVHPWKSPTNLARSPLHVALVGRKMTAVRDQLFPQKPPGSRFRFSRIPSQPYCRRVSTDRPNRKSSQLAASLEGEPDPTPAGKTLPHFFFFFFSFFSFISLIVDGPHHYHPACGHKGSSHLSPVHALQFFYRDANSALLQLVNQWLNFTYSRSHAFRYERKNTNPTLVRIELTTYVLADVQLTY